MTLPPGWAGSPYGGLTPDTAGALGGKITGLYLYEPPFIVDGSKPPAPAGYVQHQSALVAAGRRSEAVGYFMTEVIGIPAESEWSRWVDAAKPAAFRTAGGGDHLPALYRDLECAAILSNLAT
ncbi:hypothetical protein ACIBEJ_02930 [Nonomuraea sp. NPDC050790]|uniref:hypothetical protein n=1 Tax=Nonomuraea sp. NPDC050790 TaxID=3364371 RepID=UPI00379F1DFE